MKIYLSGPMSGAKDLNYPAFHEGAAILREQGYEVINPAEDDEPDNTWGQNLGADVTIIADEVDGVVVLPGWHKSRGARLEAYTALCCNKPVFDLQGMELYKKRWIMEVLTNES